jgi:thiol-disulfide isomerase/thioredoxin
LDGRVVLIDFWTYSCINCLRTLPYIKAWDRRYRRDGLTVIGMHAPEFAFERDAGNVRRAVRSNGIRYPVAQDNDFATWQAYGNQYWPAKYLIDASGRVRYTHFGEGEYGKTEQAIRSLLGVGGGGRGGGLTGEPTEQPSKLATPESYLGAERADRFANGPIEEGTRRFRLPEGGLDALPPSHLAYEGSWRVRRQSAVAGDGARLHLRFTAKRVFLVLGSAGDRPRTVAVSVDGRRRRPIRVTTHRLYEVVSLPRAGSHLLTLTPDAGTEGYAFTFG